MESVTLAKSRSNANLLEQQVNTITNINKTLAASHARHDKVMDVRLRSAQQRELKQQFDCGIITADQMNEKAMLLYK